MAKAPKHIRMFLLVLAVALISTVNVLATTGGTGEEGAKEAKKETVEGKQTAKESVDADSLKAIEKSNSNKTKSSPNKEIKKSENSQSIVSYNFVFYLMYKFKIADIFNISKKKNSSISLPSEAEVFDKGKRVLSTLVQKITE